MNHINIEQHQYSLKIKAVLDKPKKLDRERFRKRRLNFTRKAWELAKICHADVYVVVRRHEKYYTYNSTSKSTWPPSDKDLVSNPESLPQEVVIYLQKNRIRSGRSQNGSTRGILRVTAAANNRSGMNLYLKKTWRGRYIDSLVTSNESGL